MCSGGVWAHLCAGDQWGRWEREEDSSGRAKFNLSELPAWPGELPGVGVGRGKAETCPGSRDGGGPKQCDSFLFLGAVWASGEGLAAAASPPFWAEASWLPRRGVGGLA